MHETCLIVTCEHGGNDIPADFVSLFEGLRETLDSHRGYDVGALELARHFADAFEAPLFASTVSRLLIDCNRSQHNRTLFSSVTRSFSKLQRGAIVERCYLPFRQPVEKFVAERVREGHRVLHLSVHTFAPVFDGELRHGDIGLLYDPGRAVESMLCHDWQRQLKRFFPGFVVRRNYPYRGTSDGFVSTFRKRYSQEHYLGCELEVNQKHPADATDEWRHIKSSLIESFRDVYAS